MFDLNLFGTCGAEELTEADSLHHFILSAGQRLVMAFDLLLAELADLQRQIDHTARQSQRHHQQRDQQAQLNGKAIVGGLARVGAVTRTAIPAVIAEAV